MKINNHEENKPNRMMRRISYVYGGVVIATITGIILTISHIKEDKEIFAGLLVCLLLLLIYVISMYNQRLKQVLEYSYNEVENEKKRKRETEG